MIHGAFANKKKLTDDTNDLENKIVRLKELKEKDTKRFDELRRALNDETENKAKQEQEIKEIFKQRDNKKNSESQTENNVRTIQFFFEVWYRNIGQFLKKPGKKLASTG